MTNTGSQVRVFVALDIPPKDKLWLTDTIAGLQKSLATGVRWVEPQGIHLTLKFLGNIDAALVDGVQQAMARAAVDAPRFNLCLSGLGAFPNERQPRVLWAGVSGDLDSLEKIQALLEEELSQMGFARDRRPFSPHLTLGRVRDGASPKQRRDIGQAIGNTRLPLGEVWEVAEIHLIRSTLTPQGARYTSMGSRPLGVASG